MANIITDFSGEKRVVMTNARFAREPLTGFFTGWTKLRVALYLTLSDAGGNITGTPRFAFGLCSGSTNIIGDPTTTHFCGAISNSATWSYASGPPGYSSSIVFCPGKMVSTTLTVGGTFTTACAIHSSAPSFLFIDITKGSPDYSFQIFKYANVSSAPTPTLANFLTQSVASIPAFSNHNYNTVPLTLAVDEATDGVFDHGCVWWDQAVTNFNIAAWRMYRLS